MWPHRNSEDDDQLDYDVNEDDAEDFTDDTYFDGPEDFEPEWDDEDGTSRWE